MPVRFSVCRRRRESGKGKTDGKAGEKEKIKP